MRLWLSVLTVIVANAVLKASDPLLLGCRPLPAAAVKVTGLTTPVLPAGLVVAEVADVAGHGGQQLDPAQLTGLGVAALAGIARDPDAPCAGLWHGGHRGAPMAGMA